MEMGLCAHDFQILKLLTAWRVRQRLNGTDSKGVCGVRIPCALLICPVQVWLIGFAGAPRTPHDFHKCSIFFLGCIGFFQRVLVGLNILG
jgi:hypothetical protein